MGGPDYSAWHYTPDAPVRLTAGQDDTLDLRIVGRGVVGCAAAGDRDGALVDDGGCRAAEPTAEAVVPPSDVTAVDDAFEARLRTVDDAPVTGPRPLAVAPYRLALARRARGNRYVEAVIRGVAPGTTVRYTDRRPADVRAVGHPGPVLGARRGSRVRGGGRGRRPVRGPRRRGTGVGRARSSARTASRTCASTSTTSRPTGRCRCRCGSAAPGCPPTTGQRPPTPDGRLPLLDWAADTVTVQRARPGRARRSRSTSAAGGSPRPTRAARAGPGCSSPTSASRRSTTCSRSRSRRGLRAAAHVHAGHDGRRARRLLLASRRGPDQPRRLPRRPDDAPPLRRALPPRAQRRRARAHRARLPGRPRRHARRPGRGPAAPGDRGLRLAPHPVLLGRGERPRHHRGRRGHHDLPRARRGARRVLPRPAALPAAARDRRGAADRARPLRRAGLGHRLLRQRRFRRAVRARAATSAPACSGPTGRAARTCCSSTPR